MNAWTFWRYEYYYSKFLFVHILFHSVLLHIEGINQNIRPICGIIAGESPGTESLLPGLIIAKYQSISDTITCILKNHIDFQY